MRLAKIWKVGPLGIKQQTRMKNLRPGDRFIKEGEEGVWEVGKGEKPYIHKDNGLWTIDNNDRIEE